MLRSWTGPIDSCTAMSAWSCHTAGVSLTDLMPSRSWEHQLPARLDGDNRAADPLHPQAEEGFVRLRFDRRVAVHCRTRQIHCRVFAISGTDACMYGRNHAVERQRKPSFT